MTAAKVRQLASLLANQNWVRYWLVLGFPNKPYGGCIQIRNFNGEIEIPAPDSLIAHDMASEGFTWQEKYGILGWHAVIDEATVYSPLHSSRKHIVMMASEMSAKALESGATGEDSSDD
jgi:hypothetical protein